MAVWGEYTYSNYILLNPLLNSQDMKSTSFHEYTHMVLSARSCIGTMLYCLEKIKIPYGSKDIISYNALTDFLNRHTNKVQEGMAVFVECVVKILSGEPDACDDFIDNLRNDNYTYYKYVKPLLFIIDMLKVEKSREEIIKTANRVFLLGIEAMNGEIYYEDPHRFTSNKSIKKMVSNPEFAKKYLPDSRFIKNLKKCKKEATTCREIQEVIIPLLGDDVLNLTIDRSRERLHCIKKYIIDFFSCSEYKKMYENRLSEIDTVETSMNEMYSQQLPTTFNEKEVMNHSRIVKLDEFRKALYKKYSMVMLNGTFEDSLQFVFKKMGVIDEFGYDKVYFSKNEAIMLFDLERKEILMILEDIKKIDKLLLSEEKKSIIVVNYQVYDWVNNRIKQHPNLRDDIFIYCDRTYGNARKYLDLWGNRSVYYRYMCYNNLFVLIVRIEEGRFFILTMTEIVAYEADEDIRNNRKNMLMCCQEDEIGYDKYIITDEYMMDKIDMIINCLYFFTE